ncbi:tape measure protein [Lysinibacillus sp. FSL K6-3209]|uniref:tape measure protein n=1 Tax=Lysinibacillus sp. FSL K6-3209 TaxID=2921497 RepID=UPI0030DBF1F5
MLFFIFREGRDNIATIRTAIQIQDRLSQPMRAMHNAVSMMVNQMEAMNAASGHMMDTSSIEIARQELARAAEQFNQIENEIHAADNAQQNFTNHIRDGTNAADGLLGKIAGIVAAFLTLQSMGNVVKLSDEMINTQARLDLMNSTYQKNAEASGSINSALMTTAELQDSIFESAQRTATSYKSTADMVGKLGMQASAAFANPTEIIAFAEQINKTFAIAGSSAEGVSSVMLQLTQAMAAGRLQGEELGAVLDNAQPIVANIQRYLEEAMNIDASNIKKLASDGVITADIIKNAMFYAAEETNAAFGSIPTKWSDIWTVMTDRALKAFTPILQKINDVANSDRVKQMMENTTSSFEKLAIVATTAMDLLISGGSYIYDNWSVIGPVIGAVTAILTGYVAALLAVKLAKMATVLWTTISTTVTFLYAAAIGAGTGATWSMVTAAWGLNAALAANPIFIVIMAIAILIGIVYLAVAAINYFAGTSYSATGAIAGFFMMLGAYIYNVIAYLWNIFASIAEFFVNVWSHPMYSVKKLFYNLASNVLDQAIAMSSGWDKFATGFANAMIDAVNKAIQAWNWLIDLLPTDIAAKIGLGKGTEFSHRTSITSDFKGIKAGLKDWVGEAPSDYWEAPKMEMKSLGAAWDTGYNWGNDLSKGDKNGASDKSQQAIEDAMKNALGDKLDKGNQNGDKTAKNTAKAAKSLEGAGEDLKYMRDLAEREAINRYTTAEITVDMKNENYINNEMDIDGIVDKFGEKVEETVAMLAEGGPTDYV